MLLHLCCVTFSYAKKLPPLEIRRLVHLFRLITISLVTSIPHCNGVGVMQARPADYAEGCLSNQLAVSFHRHWMIDPIDVYQQWLVDKQTTEHDEL